MNNESSFYIYPLIKMGIFLVFAISCKKGDDNADLPNVSFGKITDSRDGTVYKTVTIGSQEWMVENLAYSPSNGNYWNYNNNSSCVKTYGYLYDWQTALYVCPADWHLPGNDEWTELIEYAGGRSFAGGKLKATGTIQAGTGLWHKPNLGATNETGFTALPGGYRHSGGIFDFVGYIGYWWSATEFNTDFAYKLSLHRYSSGSTVEMSGKELGFSVRCVRD